MQLDHHVLALQHLIDVCIKHPRLQNEAYCQILRQISGHTDPSSLVVLQGWFLLFLLVQYFLPKRKFFWYLQVFLERQFSSLHPGITEYVRQCEVAVTRTQENGPRECRPSKFELKAMLSQNIHLPSALQTKVISVAMSLMDGTRQQLWISPSMRVKEVVSELNEVIGMPDVAATGFALMCDWPGVQDRACYYLNPESKLCDTISLWSDALDVLTHPATHQHRFIMLTYRNRIMTHAMIGSETNKQAVLLAHQLSKEVISNRHLLRSTEEGIKMVALMAQVRHREHVCT